MILYHGSPHNFRVIKRNQASAEQSLNVPEAELQNKIYVTPDFKFALAMGVGVEGVTHVDGDTISFQNAHKFDPEAHIYVYEIESSDIPEEKLEYIDDHQYAIDLNELEPHKVTEHKAGEILTYHRLTEFRPQQNREVKFR